jgi:hypothetical protein
MKLNLVPARTGLSWIVLGVRTFVRQPLALGGLFFMFMATVSLLSVVPLLGAVATLVLMPAASLGLMAASRKADEGQFPMPLTLATAFRGGAQRSRAMLVLGGLYAAAFLMVLLLASLLGGGDAPAAAPGSENTPEAVRQALESGEFWWLLVLLLPVLMTFWHAPALVFWHGVGPVKSLFFSLMAFWANKGAMLLFVAGWMGLMLLVSLLLGLVAQALGAVQVVVVPVMLLVAAMFQTSIYFSFRDSFLDDDVPVAHPTGDSA